jgi:hypothetical protein
LISRVNFDRLTRFVSCCTRLQLHVAKAAAEVDRTAQSKAQAAAIVRKMQARLAAARKIDSVAGKVVTAALKALEQIYGHAAPALPPAESTHEARAHAMAVEAESRQGECTASTCNLQQVVHALAANNLQVVHHLAGNQQELTAHRKVDANDR